MALSQPLDLAVAALGGIPPDWILQGGAVGLLGLVVLLILRGHLVPRRVVQDVEDDRDRWRAVALKALGHADALLPAAQVAAQATKALADATTWAGERSPVGAPPDTGSST